MRIALDLRCVHPGLTGIGRYASNLLKSLQSVGGAVQVEAILTPAGADYLGPTGASSSHVVAPDRPGWDFFGLPDLLRRARVDIYHSPLFVLPPIRVCPAICTIHDVIPLVRPDLCPPKFLEYFSANVGRALAQAAHIVTVSEHSKSDLLRMRKLDDHRVSAIPEPVDPRFTAQADRPTPSAIDRLNLDPGFILSVGAIDKRKNLSGLLDAYRLLLARDRMAPPLVLVGGPSGDDYDLRREIDSRQLNPFVRPLGRVSDDVLVALYRASSVFVFPSFYEGFGLPVVEAMASGVPVVASNSSSIPEVAGDAAILVDPLDPEGMAQAMTRILGDSDLRRTMIEKGRARAARFSVESQAERLLDLYRRVARRAA